MKEQTKTTRVRVLRPFYLHREVIAAGREVELDTQFASAMVHGGKAVPLTASHVPVVVPPPDKTEFRKPDAALRAAPKGKK
jgi:hypothetical protein